MNVKIDKASLEALRGQAIAISNTCHRMEHVLVRQEVANPRVLDRLNEAQRLVDKATHAFHDALSALSHNNS